MLKRLNIIFLLMCFFVFTLCEIDAGAIDVSANSAILVEASSKTILYAKNEDVRRPMASTTKIMTAYIALMKGRLNDVVTCSPKAVRVEGSSMYLKAGEKVTLEELLYGLMLSSGNDAANVIAEHISGSIEEFVALMNKTAKEMGLYNTSFETPSGLDGENHYTTARDFALLTIEALKNEDFAKIVKTKSITFNKENGSRTLVNHNRLLRSYEYAVGVKTGFTKKAGRCLVSAAEKDGVTLVAVTLDASNDWRDHKNMLDFGFSKTKNIKLTDESDVYNLRVVSSDVKSVNVSPKRDKTAVIFDNDNPQIKKIVELPRFAYAPIAAGEKVGAIRYYINGKELDSVDLVATQSAPLNVEAEKGFFERLFGWLK